MPWKNTCETRVCSATNGWPEPSTKDSRRQGTDFKTTSTKDLRGSRKNQNKTESNSGEGRAKRTHISRANNIFYRLHREALAENASYKQ